VSSDSTSAEKGTLPQSIDKEGIETQIYSGSTDSKQTEQQAAEGDQTAVTTLPTVYAIGEGTIKQVKGKNCLELQQVILVVFH